MGTRKRFDDPKDPSGSGSKMFQDMAPLLAAHPRLLKKGPVIPLLATKEKSL